MDWFADLFKPSGLNHPALFAKLFCAVLAIQLLFSFREQYLYFLTKPEKIYGAPPKLLGLFRIPRPGKTLFLLLGCLLLLSLCAVTAGFFQRFFVLIALLSYFFYFTPIMSLAYIQRKTNLLPFVLLVLLFSPSTGNSIHTPGTAWELTLIKIAIAQLYLSAGLQKIRHSGFTWLSGKSLQAYLLENYLWSDQKAALQLALRPRLCLFTSVLVLLFELSFWIIIPIPSLTLIYVAGGLLFHIGTLVTMRINYLKYLLPVYMIFLTDMIFKLLTGAGI
jgi:hypothetical protein